jgi:hypothetical protein
MSDFSINQRLIKIIEYKEITQENLRISLGVKNAQQVSNWIKSKERIPEKHIVRIIQLFKDINPYWFIDGEGEMLNKKSSNGDLNVRIGEVKGGAYAGNHGNFESKTEDPKEENNNIYKRENELLKQTIEDLRQQIKTLNDMITLLRN